MLADLLPSWVRGFMARDFIRKGAGGELETLWYEYPRRSNFDKLDRQKIRDTAEEDGFITLRRIVTDVGIDWAREELK